MIKTRYRQVRASERRFAEGEIMEGSSLLHDNDLQAGDSTPTPTLVLSEDRGHAPPVFNTAFIRSLLPLQPSLPAARPQTTHFRAPPSFPNEETAQA